MPTVGYVGMPVNVTVVIRNDSSRLEQMVATVEPAEGFMFAGRRLTTLNLRPFHEHALRYTTVPYQVGRLALPLLKIGPPSTATPIGGPPAMAEAGAMSVGPLHVFVHPEPVR